jgi:predicted permease
VRSLLAFLKRLVDPFQRRSREQQLDDELAAHIQLHVDDNLRQGMTEAEARRQALLKLGGLQQTKERYRDRRGLPGLDALRQDAQQAVRVARGQLGFTLVAMGTLALGIGAVAVIYSVVRAILLDPFPYVHQDRMVDVVVRDGGTTRLVRGALPGPEFLDYQEQSSAFEEVLGTVGTTVHFVADDDAERMRVVRVTPNMFSFLGVAPLMGRAFGDADGKASAPCVAELSHRTWATRLGSDPRMLGRTVLFDGQPCTVIGIMPRRFEWHVGDFWVPTPIARDSRDPVNTRWFQARLRPGVTVEAAEAEMNGIARRRAAIFPLEYPKQARIEVITIIDWVVGRFRRVLYTLFAAVGLLLLIACANVANMLLARGIAREREILVRVALGAGRTRIIRQLLFENLLLAAGGGLGGCLLAFAGIRALSVWMPRQNVPWETELRLDAPVLVFALATAVLSTLIFGLYPAFHTTRRDVASMSPQSRGGTATRRQARIRGGLVVAEVALSVILLLGTGVLVRNFVSLVQVNLGFDSEHVLSTRVAFAPGTYTSPERRMRFYSDVLDRIQRVTGVQSAALSNGMAAFGGFDSAIRVTGQAPDERASAFVKCVSESYGRTIGVLVLSGRDLTRADIESPAQVAVVNESFVKRYFGAENPLGRAIDVSIPDSDTPLLSQSHFEVVGVIRDIVNDDIREPVTPEAYVPLAFLRPGSVGLAVRTAGDPLLLAGAIRREIRAIDGTVALTQPLALDSEVNQAFYAQPRFVLIVLGLFAVTGLLLVAVGIYGVLAYIVSQHTRDIAIRLAIGGDRGHILRFIIFMGLRLVVLGTGIGLVASLGTNRLLESQLWRTSPHDTTALVLVLVTIAVIGVAACLIPARRAMQIEPMSALRQE